MWYKDGECVGGVWGSASAVDVESLNQGQLITINMSCCVRSQ